MKKIGLSIFLGFLFLCHSSFGTFSSTSHAVTSYTKEQIENFIREVYAGSAESLFFKPNTTRLQLTTDFLQRVHIVKDARYQATKHILLSSFALVTDYNPSLKRDVVIDPSTFNPLKYDFDWFSKSRKVICVDNSDYVIIIEARNY